MLDEDSGSCVGTTTFIATRYAYFLPSMKCIHHYSYLLHPTMRPDQLLYPPLQNIVVLHCD
eukprot:12890967-Ditylum_brightwellii.AAC.1